MYKKHSLLEEVDRIEEERKSGCLKLRHGDQVVEIHFREGLIEAVSSNLSEHRLGQYLLREGFLDVPKLDRLLRKSRRKKNALGETALRSRILDASQLTRLIHLQASTLLRLCLAKGFQVHLFEAAAPSFNCSTPINPHALLLELARVDSNALVLDSDHLIQLRKQKGISFLPWSPQELSVLSDLNVPKTLEGLVSGTGIQRSKVRSILKILFDLGFIEVSKEFSSEKTSLVKKVPLHLLIPEIRHPALSDKLEVLKHKSSFVSEQFASLKVRIDGTGKDRPAQVISVCSAHLQDGKSLIASNLALSYAQDPGRRVILLDCDLRNPSIQKYFGIPSEPGIISYLKDARLEPYCYMRRVGSLYLMTAGGIADNAVELLSHPRMLELMDYLRKEFDTVVLDSAPLDLVTDTRILFRITDGILLVIRRAKSPYGAVERTFKVLDQSKFIGVVFNDVKPQLFNTYYDYSNYHYGYGQYPDNSEKGRKLKPRRNKGVL